jgi:acetylornithine aminotransferase
MNNAMIQGNKIVSELKKDLGDLKDVVSIRNAGLMIGIELSKPCGELIKLGLDAGLLINVTAEKVIRLLPPLIINDEETSLLISKLSELVKNFLKS